MIEVSINSFIISYSFAISDKLEKIILQRFFQNFTKCHESVVTLRKVPREGYHVSFLITDSHAQNFNIDEVEKLFASLVIVLPTKFKEAKTYINNRARQFTKEIYNCL